MAEADRTLDRLLAGVERPARYIDCEWGARHKPGPVFRFALVYPDAYEIGQANQGLGILYDRLNVVEGVAAERAFVPWKDMAAAMRAAGVPLATLETGTPLADCDVVGFTLPYELTYANVLEALDLAGVALRSADRAEGAPIVVAGGPCALNPEPLAAFLDAVFVGDGEHGAVEIAQTVRGARQAGADRAGVLEALARVPGVYVPTLYAPGPDGGLAPLSAAAPERVTRRVVPDLDAEPSVACPVVPFVDVVHDRVTVEVTRGCTRGCRFCHAGMVYRPVRERTADSIVRDVMAGLRCTGYEEVSLTSLSTTDHSQLPDVLRRLARRLEGSAVAVSLPSLRADAFGVRMAQLVSRGKKPGLTLAPEAGTQRMRDVINKNVTEDDLLAAVREAFSSGWRRLKLYFMVGLPTETDEDITAIGELVGRVFAAARDEVPPGDRGSVRVAVSVSTFVPKAHTPFQWEAQLSREEVARRQTLLRASVPRKGVDLSWHDPDVSFLEGALARGGREIADVVEAAWRSGAVFDAWTDEFEFGRWLSAFETCGVDPADIACRERDRGESMPWDHVRTGIDPAYLWRERERALRGETTGDCSCGPCTGCGVCPDLGVEVRTAGERRG